MDAQQRTEALMARLEFLWDDLEYNRNGEFSEKQRERLKRLFRGQARWMTFLMVVYGLSALVLELFVGAYLLANDMSFSRLFRTQYGGLGVVLLIVALGSFAVVAIHGYPMRKLVNNPTLHVVRGVISKDIEGIGPDRKTFTSPAGIVAGGAFLAGMVARNVLSGQRRGSGKYKIVTGYQIKVGDKVLYILKQWGEPFVDKTEYTVYYVNVYPRNMIIAAEAH